MKWPTLSHPVPPGGTPLDPHKMCACVHVAHLAHPYTYTHTRAGHREVLRARGWPGGPVHLRPAQTLGESLSHGVGHPGPGWATPITHHTHTAREAHVDTKRKHIFDAFSRWLGDSLSGVALFIITTQAATDSLWWLIPFALVLGMSLLMVAARGELHHNHHRYVELLKDRVEQLDFQVWRQGKALEKQKLMVARMHLDAATDDPAIENPFSSTQQATEG